MNKLRNIHPGEILLEEFLLPMQISQTKLANSIGVPPRRINEIVLGKRGITADTALRLSKVFGNSVQFWMGLQDENELREARSAIKDQLERMMPIAAKSFRRSKSTPATWIDLNVIEWSDGVFGAEAAARYHYGTPRSDGAQPSPLRAGRELGLSAATHRHHRRARARMVAVP